MASKVNISACFSIFGLAVFLLLFATGCSLTKTVPKDSHLLMKVKYEQHGAKEDVKKLPNYKERDRYQPNKKIMGITRFQLRLYNVATHPSDTARNNKKLRKFFRNAGDPPVLFDSAMADATVKNIQQFLFNSGYYHAEVYYEVVYKRKKVKVLTYHVTPGKYYATFSYEMECADSVLAEIINKERHNSFIKGGRRLEFEQISKERDRIFSLLRNKGYYAFKKEYLDFEIDTFQTNNSARVRLFVSLPEGAASHSTYSLGRIFVKINSPYHRPLEDFVVFDSVQYYMNLYPVSAKVVHSKQDLRQGDLYNQSSIDLTYRKLSELGVFSNIEIKVAVADSFRLNLEIVLTPDFLQSFTVEPQLISSDLSNQITNMGNYRNYGVAGVLTYSHKNIFKGAERLDLSFTLRAETQLRAKEQLNRFFTNFQAGVTSNLYIPTTRLWHSFAEKRGIASVKSVVSLSYIYENNLDFNRHILPLSYSYQFIKGRSVWFFTPLEIFYSNSHIEPGFLDKISPRNLEFVKRLFANNLITSSGLRWSRSYFKSGNPKDYVIWRMNVVEVGGNIHRLARRAMDAERQTDTSYSLLGVNYFQFVKSEIDLWVGKYIDVNNALAFRLNVGAGIPYGNDDILPFDKRFFIGGSNSLRGWRPRTLGPGSYRDTASGMRIDRSGDLIIQGSIEYRFKFISPLELGVFVDAGNVWNIVPNAGTSPAEMFSYKRFLGEMAINTGIGFRFDFEFFVFRLDWGIQLKDPEVAANNGWVARGLFRPGGINLTVLNLGIGYPF